MWWLQLLLSLSGESTKFCEQIVEVGLHTDMLRSLNWDTLSLESLKKSEENVKISFVETQINVLYNVVRRAESARSAFRQCNAVDIIQKFRDVTEQPVCFLMLYHIYVQESPAIRYDTIRYDRRV